MLVHHLLRGTILSGFAFLIVYLTKTDQLALYIAPRMATYVKLSAIGLYAASMYQFYLVFRIWSGSRTEPDCDCDHTPSPSLTKNTMIYGLFLLPLCLGFLLPNTIMDSTIAAKKGMSLNGAINIARPSEAKASGTGNSPSLADASPSNSTQGRAAPSPDDMFPSDVYTESYAAYAKKLYTQDLIEVSEKQFIEILTTLDLYREPFLGKQVALSGFVYREPEMSASRFALSRFAMNCCSADALPYGLMVTYPKAEKYKNDTWLKITGTLELSEYKGNPVLQLKAAELESIPAPDSPYVYPDYDFGS
ncbi:TIGR03943 family putative permease subunit [Paenibacillus sp. GCM10012307]|uniref:TIGR03943 family protein n=1 Tax=Paenibacillus roseus TaxID=2798579 RepID=A0A934J5X1_9BACL|nr:TIGR03943 family protein [Paenibacillus roseus]MBJ6362314.1 TIGR03943 family protein [Paenibacillus roseus]